MTLLFIVLKGTSAEQMIISMGIWNEDSLIEKDSNYKAPCCPKPQGSNSQSLVFVPQGVFQRLPGGKDFQSRSTTLTK